MPKSIFAGDKKEGEWLVAGLERRWVNAVLPHIPQWLEGYHLTLLALLWSGLVILFDHWAATNIEWLWGVSAMIIAQNITDSLDGALGRFRDTGIPRWGYYMDHFLDYIFLASLFIGYSFIIPPESHIFLWGIFIVAAGFMASSYLAFAATNEFRIATFYIGPTEGKILLIIANAVIIFFGPSTFLPFLPLFLVIALLILGVAVAHRQAAIWRMDMEAKNEAPRP